MSDWRDWEWPGGGVANDPEETPEPLVYVPARVSGNVRSCYVCDRDLMSLKGDYVVKRHSSDLRFFVSICIWCADWFRSEQK